MVPVTSSQKWFGSVSLVLRKCLLVLSLFRQEDKSLGSSGGSAALFPPVVGESCATLSDCGPWASVSCCVISVFIAFHYVFMLRCSDWSLGAHIDGLWLSFRRRAFVEQSCEAASACKAARPTPMCIASVAPSTLPTPTF